MSSAALIAIAVAAIAAIVVLRWWAGNRKPRENRPPPYIAALGALIDGDEETALAEFKNAVRLDSSNVDAYLRLGSLMRRRGDLERAFHLHRELSTRTAIPKSTMARVHEELSRDCLALGRLEKAAEAAREAARLSEEPGGGHEVLVEVLTRLGDVDGAFKVKREVLKKKARARELADFRAEQGKALLQGGNLKEAEKILKDARRVEPGSPKTRLYWGMLEEQRGNYAAAIEEWTSLLRDQPEDPEPVFRDLERVHFLNGSFSDMEGAYGRFLESTPGHPGASLGLARFLRRKGQLDEALGVCRRGLDAHPEDEKLRTMSLALLLQTGRSGEAEAILNEWLAESPGESAEGHPHVLGTPS